MTGEGSAANTAEDGARAALQDLVAGRPAGPPRIEARDGFRRLAAEHGLSGVAAAAIRSGSLIAPPDVADGLRRDWAAARMWSGLLDLEVHRIATGLRENRDGLAPPILLKGPAVARHYRDPSLRSYVDVDILVPHAELGGWARFLTGLGYVMPSGWERRDASRYQPHIIFPRPVDGGELTCEVHWCLSLERRARRLGHDALLHHTEPSRWPGIRWANQEAQLVILAVHLVHHTKQDRRMIWLRDFIELGQKDVVEGARKLSAEWNLTWALERALRDTERLLGRPIWNARPPEGERFGLATVTELENPGILYHLATMRELGLPDAVRYLGSRLGPGRFGRSTLDPEGNSLSGWATRLLRTIRATPWRRGVSEKGTPR
jgi:Uncharacterised nucleotidyltransferase